MSPRPWVMVRVTKAGATAYDFDPYLEVNGRLIARRKPFAWGWRSPQETGASAYASDLATARALAMDAFEKGGDFNPFRRHPSLEQVGTRSR